MQFPHRQHPTPPSSSPEPMSFGSEAEDKLPSKMRKSWIHRSYEALRDTHPKETEQTCYWAIPSSSDKLQEGAERTNVDEHAFEMPPLPLPQSHTLHAIHTPPLPSSLIFPPKSVNDDQLSPSIPFSKLSLLSLLIPSPAHCPTERDHSLIAMYTYTLQRPPRRSDVRPLTRKQIFIDVMIMNRFKEAAIVLSKQPIASSMALFSQNG